MTKQKAHKYSITLLMRNVDGSFAEALYEKVICTFEAAWFMVMGLNRASGVRVNEYGTVPITEDYMFSFKDYWNL